MSNLEQSWLKNIFIMAVFVLTWVSAMVTSPCVSKARIIEILGSTLFIACELVVPRNRHFERMNCVSDNQVSSTLMIRLPCCSISSSLIPNRYLKIKFCSEFPRNWIFFTGLNFIASCSRKTLHTKAFFTSNWCLSLTRCLTIEDL